MTIRILIAEDHTVLRAALRNLLETEPDLEVVGEAADVDAVLCLSSRVSPDIILLDIALPNLQGFASICSLIRALPDMQVLLLTDYQDADLLRNGLLAGIWGCVVRQSANST